MSAAPPGASRARTPKSARPEAEPAAAGEPFYIRQTADPMTDAEARWWLRLACQEAHAEGATWFRASYHPDIDHLRILEAWRTRPEHEGDIRWALTATPATASPVADQPTHHAFREEIE